MLYPLLGPPGHAHGNAVGASTLLMEHFSFPAPFTTPRSRSRSTDKGWAQVVAWRNSVGREAQFKREGGPEADRWGRQPGAEAEGQVEAGPGR